MFKLILNFSVLFLNLNFIAGQDYKFPIFTGKLFYYHTRVDYRSNTHGQSAYIEEFFNYQQRKGRLDIVTNGTQYKYLYEYDTQQIMQISAGQCHVYDNTGSLADIMHYIFDPRFYRFVDANEGSAITIPSAGPTSLLRQVIRGINNGTLKYTSASSVTSIRNISCRKFTVTGGTLNNPILFYFMDPSWNKYEKLDQFKSIPVRVSIVNGTTSDGTLLDVDMDYFLFENVYVDWADMTPPIGVGCKGKNSTQDLPEISNKFRTNVEIFDLLSQMRAPDVKEPISKVNINFDGFNQLIRIDNYDTITEETSSTIIDFNRGISYSLNSDESCIIRHIESSILENDVNSMAFMKSAMDLLNFKNDSYYMGRTVIRGIICDIWERVMYNFTAPGDFQKTLYAKVVITNYILNKNSKEVSDDVTGGDVPIKTIYTGYNVDGQDISFQTEMNFFSFADTLESDDDLMGVFDVRNCFAQQNMRKYIELYIPLENTNSSVVQQNIKQFRELLKETISNEAEVSILRVPFMELDFTYNAIMANVMILDRENISLSFRKYPNSMPQKNEIKVHANTDNACAVKTLARNAKGFHWCRTDNNCYIKTDSNINPNQGKPVDLELTEKCTLYMLDIKITNDYLFSNANLTTALLNLDSVINSGNFNFQIFLDDGSNISFTVKRLIISDQVVVDVNGNSLFSLALNGYSLSPKLLSTKAVSVTSVNSLSSIGDCYDACASDTSIECSSFSYCRAFDESTRCLISSHLIYDKMPNQTHEVLSDSECNTYSIPYLNRFRRLDGQVVLSSGDQNSKTDNANLCAQQCSQYKQFHCKSFQYCETGECFLRKAHLLDFDSENSNSNSGLNDCAFYTAKYLTDYKTTGFNTVSDKKALRVSVESAEICAKQCSTQTDNCQSFNFCPGIHNESSYCELSSLSVNSLSTNISAQGFCRHYELINKTLTDNENDFSDDNTDGMTSSSFFGLIFGLFILGIILGGVSYIGIQYYRREVKNRNAPDLSVRFSNNKDN